MENNSENNIMATIEITNDIELNFAKQIFDWMFDHKETTDIYLMTALSAAIGNYEQDKLQEAINSL